MPRSVHNNVGGLVLVTKGVPSQDNWLSPSWDQFWNVCAENRLTEDSSSQNVANRALEQVKRGVSKNLLSRHYR